MATLILSAVGSAVGGPIGGAIGALLGRQIDTSVIGRPKREGPRLTELAVTTSSYGQPVPRVFGTMRLPGTIIWATDLAESSETSGGKGQPKTTTYSYSISFAVALASRPIAAVGRVWADGALLRGGAGDLKVGGTMRLSRGHGDEAIDPLIGAAQASLACAFRGLAYAVFEDLELASFGNRIPALSFEVIAADGALDIVDLLGGVALAPGASVPLGGLSGFADEGGTRAALLAQVAGAFPLVATASPAGIGLAPLSREAAQAATPAALPPAIIGRIGAEDAVEPVATRRAPDRQVPTALRYYDLARDYQPSLQRAPGVGSDGATIEFAGVFGAGAAQARMAELYRQALTSRESLTYRIDEPGEDYGPGRYVTRAGDSRHWLVRSWEWHADGLDLALERAVTGAPAASLADPGEALPPIDSLPGALHLRYFELPWDGLGSGKAAQVYAAISLRGARGAIDLSGVVGESLVPLGQSARGLAVQGESVTALAGSPALVFERDAALEIALTSAQDQLQSVTESALLNGANQLLLGEEILQFRLAEPLGAGHWRLTGLLRGRGGTEHLSAAGHPAGTAAVLLDERLVALAGEPFDEIGAAIALTGVAPAYATLGSPGSTVRPLAPVHPSLGEDVGGDPEWRWVRRARGAWRWLDLVDVPLVEEREAYRVGFGPVETPVSQWDTTEPVFSLPAAEWIALTSAHPGASLWVRQVGSHAVSLPTLLPV